MAREAGGKYPRKLNIGRRKTWLTTVVSHAVNFHLHGLAEGENTEAEQPDKLRRDEAQGNQLETKEEEP